MDAIGPLTFRAPMLLWAILATPLALVFLVLRERTRRALSARFVSERIRGRDRWRDARPWLLTLAIAASLFALAGPRLGFVEVETEGRESNRILVLDVSNSMGAEDVGTSRLAAAKAVASKLIAAQNGKVALVVFEAVPQVVSPLTSDGEAVSALLESLDTGELSEAGSDLGAAVRQAIELASAGGRTATDIVVITDGENRDGDLDRAIGEAKKAGIAVSGVVVGSASGAKIPLPDGGFLKDEQGNDVVTAAHRETLDRLAAATGGKVFVNPFSESELGQVTGQLAQLGGTKSSRESARVPIDRYQWPLAAGLFLFLTASLLNRSAE